MHVLGLTNMRFSEMRDPFEAMGEHGSLVTIDTDGGVQAYLSAFRRGRRYIEEWDSDAILVYNGSGLIGIVGALLSHIYEIPLLIRINGDIIRQHREQAIQHIERREWWSLGMHALFASMTRITFRYATGFVPVSETLVDVLSDQTGDSVERFVPVPNPVRVEEYAITESQVPSYRTGSGTLLLTVTNLNFRGKYEGVVELVKSIVPVLRRHPDAEYVIAGDGRYYDDFKRTLDTRVTDQSVRNRIHSPGFVEDIANLYAEADIFLYASDIDGYPNVILEAQAAGLPIVTTPTYGIKEQIDDGVSGVFAEPNEGFTEMVDVFIDDAEKRQRLGRNARRRVETENNPAVVGKALYDAVQRLVERVP